MFENDRNKNRDRRKSRVRLNMRSGTPVEGYLFCSVRERASDLLNDERSFFPFESLDGDSFVVSKDSIDLVELLDERDGEGKRDLYAVLGMSHNSPWETVEATYNKKMAQLDRNRLEALDLPEEVMAFASQAHTRLALAFKKAAQQPKLVATA